jgi:hypothetical protein
MSDTPTTTVMASAGSRSNLNTHRRIGEKGRLLETHSMGVPWLGEVAGKPSFRRCSEANLRPLPRRFGQAI